jgi:prefoldin subunit 5
MQQIDYSVGFTTSEVEEILAVQKNELKKTLAAYADSGSSVTKRRIEEIHAIIGACQKALQKLDPARFPPPRRIAVSRVDRSLGT